MSMPHQCRCRVCNREMASMGIDTLHTHLMEQATHRLGVIQRLEAERDKLRETVKRLNRRCQEAEAAIPDYRKILALPPDGDGVRFVSGSLGRALLALLASKLEDECEALRKDAERYRFLFDLCEKSYNGNLAALVDGYPLDWMSKAEVDAKLDAARLALLPGEKHERD